MHRLPFINVENRQEDNGSRRLRSYRDGRGAGRAADVTKPPVIGHSRERSGLGGKIVAAVVGQFFPPTEAEEKGLVNRERLRGISGRTRTVQYELAKHFDIKDIPQPGGGCILTDPEYGQRMKKLISIKPNFDASDARLLRFCRPIWEGRTLIAVARDKNDCEKMNKSVKAGDVLLEPVNFPGPTVIGRNFGDNITWDEVAARGKKYLLQYSKKIPAVPEITIKNV